jgi:hypothetical protein
MLPNQRVISVVALSTKPAWAGVSIDTVHVRQVEHPVAALQKPEPRGLVVAGQEVDPAKAPMIDEIVAAPAG